MKTSVSWRRWPQRHGVPFYREETRQTGCRRRRHGATLEQCARRARLRFFSRLIGEGKANRIATGHTRDDQAETVLFRLLRGSGLAGLAGILPVTAGGFDSPAAGRGPRRGARSSCARAGSPGARMPPIATAALRGTASATISCRSSPGNGIRRSPGRWRTWRIWPAKRSDGGKPRSGRSSGKLLVSRSMAGSRFGQKS